MQFMKITKVSEFTSSLLCPLSRVSTHYLTRQAWQLPEYLRDTLLTRAYARERKRKNELCTECSPTLLTRRP